MDKRRGLALSKSTSESATAPEGAFDGVYANRTSSGNCHYRDIDGDTDAGAAASQGASALVKGE